MEVNVNILPEEDRRITHWGLTRGNWITILLVVMPITFSGVYVYAQQEAEVKNIKEKVTANTKKIEALPKQIDDKIQASEKRIMIHIDNQETRAVLRQEQMLTHIKDIIEAGK